MRGKSHNCMGRYLIRHYMPQISEFHQRAFLIGCVEPDRNPATYLKGSLRHQWLRGHNYRNASRFMQRIARRLEGKQKLNFFDYYTLGKLIHYTADAFTYAHNESFPTDLGQHMEYEAALQNHFLAFMESVPSMEFTRYPSIMEAIRSFHREYQTHPAGIHTDSRFALGACCGVMTSLFP